MLIAPQSTILITNFNLNCPNICMNKLVFRVWRFFDLILIDWIESYYIYGYKNQVDCIVLISIDPHKIGSSIPMSMWQYWARIWLGYDEAAEHRERRSGHHPSRASLRTGVGGARAGAPSLSRFQSRHLASSGPSLLSWCCILKPQHVWYECCVSYH